MELESTRIFVKVVQLGSFSKAADLLRLPKSTVSRTVSRLESESGTQLLLRTTRSLTLTAAGRAFYESSLGAIQILEDARRSLQGQDSIIAGTVRITAPEDLGSYVLSPVIAKLSAEHTGLSFDLNYTVEVIDLVRDGYDLAVRIGKMNPSSFKVNKLGESILVPIASPEYLRRKGKIRAPQELASHDCITFSPESAHPKWVLQSKKGSVSVAIRPKITSNQMTSLIKMAIEGVGVAMVPSYLCKAELASGELVRVLPEWSEERFPVSLVSPLGSGASSRIKLISERLASAIQGALKAE